MTWSDVTTYVADPSKQVSLQFPAVLLVSSDANCRRNNTLKANYYRSNVIHRPEFQNDSLKYKKILSISHPKFVQVIIYI